MTTTTAIIETVILAEIADRKAAARSEIAQLSASLVENGIRFLDSNTARLQFQSGVFKALDFAEFDIRETASLNDDVELALIEILNQLVRQQGEAVINSGRESRDVAEGRAAAINAIASTVRDLFRDVKRGVVQV